MNAIVIEVSRRADQKLYPARPLSAAERTQAHDLAHALVHRDSMSIRQAQRTMIESYGVRRSLGSIARDLRLWECDVCADWPGGQRPIPLPPAVHGVHGAGWAGPAPA